MFFLFGCQEAPQSIQLHLKETSIATTFRVVWDTENIGRGKVEYGPDESYAYASSWGESGTHHKAVIFGVPPGESWYWRAVFEDEAGTQTTLPGGIVTAGESLDILPVLQAEGAGMGEELVLVAMVDRIAFVIVDGLGRYRWWITEDDTKNYSLRARLSLDGEAIWYQLCPKDNQSSSYLVRVGLDGQEEARFEVPAGTHDFTETPDALASIVFDTRDTVRGDSIVETYPDGSSTTIYTVWSDFDPASSGDEPPSWSHANSLDYQDDRYLFGIRNFGSILSISREGELEWGFSGDANQFSFTEGSGFRRQHQFQLQNNQLVSYVNSWPEPASTSIGAWSLDETTLSASPTWRYERPEPFHTGGFGSVGMLPDGGLFISWGTEGQLERTDAELKQSWWLESPEPLGYASVIQAGQTGLVLLAD
jgi:hypothetical protein